MNTLNLPAASSPMNRAERKHIRNQVSDVLSVTRPFAGMVLNATEEQILEAEDVAYWRVELNKHRRVGSTFKSYLHGFEVDYFGALFEILIRDLLLPVFEENGHGEGTIQFAPLVAKHAQRGSDVTMWGISYNLKAMLPSNKGFACIPLRAYQDKRQVIDFYWFGRFVNARRVHVYAPIRGTCVADWRQWRGKKRCRGLLQCTDRHLSADAQPLRTALYASAVRRK